MEAHHEELCADFSRLEVVHTADLPWTASPSPGVLRKRIELYGPAERGRVTSVVRYVPGSRFPGHEHPEGEEILVLDGVFSDEEGDYPAGTYLLSPEGYVHAPFSVPGCVLFVKLRQYAGVRPRVRLDTKGAGAAWEPYRFPGVERLVLYAEHGQAERMHLLRIAGGTALPSVELEGGEENFVLEGSFADEYGSYREGSWIRYPPGASHAPRTVDGCKLYVKLHHQSA
jgi:anti-sigma factor ChrR (cupin superfamily)